MRIFKSKAIPDEEGYFDAVAAASVPAGEMTAVTINGQKLILTRYDNTFYAFNAACPHAAADLTDGWLSRYKVTCPDHDYCFDMRDGRLLWPEDEIYRLQKYDLKEVDGMIKVRL